MPDQDHTKRRNRRYSQSEREEMQQRYEAGETTPMIAATMGCPVPTVGYILRQRGVVMRPSGPPPEPVEVIKERKAERQRQWRATANGRAAARKGDRKRRSTPEGKAEKATQAGIYRQRHPQRVANIKRKCYWWSRHGITEEQYEEMLAQQGGKCAICGTVKPGGPKPSIRFCVDHDHADGRIRGLLCFRCNTTLGQLGDTKDSVEAWAKTAVSYLDKEKA